MRVYVAAGSSEVSQAAEYIRRLLTMGVTITHDWTITVMAHGTNPREAHESQRLAWANEDLRGIDAAQLVWVILPAANSIGCSVEMGYALGRRIPFVISGDWASTIFSSFASRRYDTHEEALAEVGRVRL